MWRIRYPFVAVLNTLAVIVVAFSLTFVQVKGSESPRPASTPNPAKVAASELGVAEVLVHRQPWLAGTLGYWLVFSAAVLVTFCGLIATRWPREPSPPALMRVVCAAIVIGAIISLPCWIALAS
jgi:hypothetical protein